MPLCVIRAVRFVALAVLAGCAATGGRSPGSADPARTGQVPTEIPADAQSLFDQAARILADGDLVEAELRFEEFVLHYPDFPGAHVNLAIIHAQNGDDAAAEASLTDALLLDPANPVALNQLGMLLRRQGRFEDAEAAYLRALEAEPGYELAHFNIGVLYELYLRRLEPALTHFQRYQDLGGADTRVAKWITDLKRRLAAEQRAANVTE